MYNNVSIRVLCKRGCASVYWKGAQPTNTSVRDVEEDHADKWSIDGEARMA